MPLPINSGFPFLAPFPLNPAPTVTSVTSVGTSGGSATCNGTGFIQTPTASVNINGTPTSLSVTWVSSTQLVELLLVGGSYTAGNWDLTITNPDGQQCIGRGIFNISAETTPATIFGANLVGWWIAKNATTSGSNVTGVPDSSGNSNPLNVVSSTPPTVVTNDSAFVVSGVTTIAHNGSSSYLHSGTISLGSTVACAILGAAYQVNLTNQQAWAHYNNNPVIFTYNGTNELVIGGSSSGLYADTNAVSLPSPPAVTFYGAIGNSGTTQTAYVSMDNTAVVTNTSSSAVALSNGPITIGAQWGGGSSYTNYANIRWPETILVNVVPTSAQVTAYTQYLNDVYGVTTPPAVTYATPILANTSGTAFRVIGTGFLPMISANLIKNGTTYALTVVDNTTTVIDMTAPSVAAGVYDLQILNVDGRTVTYNNYVTVSSNANPISIFGLSCVGWYGNQMTVSGSNVTSWLDLSGMGNNVSQTTGADQPTYHSGAGDSTFNYQPYITPNGTSDFLFTTTPNTTNNALNALGLCAVVASGTSANPAIVFSLQGKYAIAVDNLYPSNYDLTAGALNFGATVSGVKNIVATVPSGSSPTKTINMSNGTAATQTTSNGAMGAANFAAFSRTTSGQYYGTNPTACIVVLNAVPTSGQLSAWESYCQSTYGAT